MKVFIEQACENNKKNVFDKETGGFLKTVDIDMTYPYPYGYILETIADDGDNLDCYVMTDQKLEMGSIVECDPVGMVEWFEDGEDDHKILATLQGHEYEVTEKARRKITNFAEHFFDDQPDKKYRMGEFLGKERAVELIKKATIERPIDSEVERPFSSF